MSTESELHAWRTGSIMAERLCASILALQNFREIDPQAPLGGPDDRKDILCFKSGISYVAGVYFPPTPKEFKDVEEKFLHDLEGVKRHHREGFCFLTNQRLTIGQRDTLQAAGLGVARDCEIFHLERIRAILDQPTGFGARLEYLRIPLSPEEQFAYFANSRDTVEKLAGENNQLIRLLHSKMDKVLTDQRFVVQTLALSAEQNGFDVSPPPSRPDLFLGSGYRANENANGVTSNISIELLLFLHRTICFDVPSHEVGALRTREVILSRADASPPEAVAKPPSPADLPSLLSKLCDEWNDKHSKSDELSEEVKITSIAWFHASLLKIHPFIDGNGRVARAILMQQCLDLFGVAEMGLLDKGAAYYTALLQADEGKMDELINLLKPVVGIDRNTS